MARAADSKEARAGAGAEARLGRQCCTCRGVRGGGTGFRGLVLGRGVGEQGRRG